MIVSSVIHVDSSIIPGDIDCDGKVNVIDGNAIIRIILGKAVYANAADINGDGKVNVIDASCLKAIILGKYNYS